MYKEQWNVIIKVANLLGKNNMHYHFDASTSVFVHGIEFDMDDIDIVFMWHEENRLKEILKDYVISETKFMPEYGLKYFWSEMDGQKVHCLFYGNDNDIVTEQSFNSNAVMVHTNGYNIMAQSLEFYLKNSKDKNNLKLRIYEFLSAKG